ncbi:uncharacterized protein BN458_01830 [Prevotella sp. CAG:1058]|nr:uncharacterized protein BN458_01830 [Prevotella sp. CAG:1058]
MDDRNITGGNRHNSCNQSLFNDIMLGRTEMYDASKLSCWPFCRATDVRDGIPLSLGNLCKGYPFALNGHIFLTSEAAYLCGEFSDSSSKQSIQYSLMEEPNAFLAKKVIKRKNLKYVRQDWEEIRLQWMLYVVWRKCVGNVEFRNLLLSLPDDAVIIEDSTANYGATSSVWGGKNKRLRQVRRQKKKELCALYTAMKKKDLNTLISRECGKITDVGFFVGENNMGKILMMCKIALKHHITPPIDYNLLREKQIYLFGELQTFDYEEAI